jgi:hypothetical protein
MQVRLMLNILLLLAVDLAAVYTVVAAVLVDTVQLQALLLLKELLIPLL